MKFSIITPEHQINNVFINELYDSIKQQSYSNWEWILYLNGQCKKQNIPEIAGTYNSKHLNINRHVCKNQKHNPYNSHP